MTVQIGHYALILALVVALAQALMALAARLAIAKTPQAFGRAGALLQVIFISAAVLSLVVLPPTEPAQGRGAWLVWGLLTLMTVLACVALTVSLSHWSSADAAMSEARPAENETPPPDRPSPSERAVLTMALGLASAIVIAAAGLVALLEREPEGQEQIARPGGEMAGPGGESPHPGQGPDVMAMVEGLDARLKTDPHDPQGWEMLMRSRVNLGQMDLAEAAFRDARAAYASDPEQLASFRRTARTLGIPGT